MCDRGFARDSARFSPVFLRDHLAGESAAMRPVLQFAFRADVPGLATTLMDQQHWTLLAYVAFRFFLLAGRRNAPVARTTNLGLDVAAFCVVEPAHAIERTRLILARRATVRTAGRFSKKQNSMGFAPFSVWQLVV